ncbi:MAG: type II secretion system F family protein [Oscillospiraceae bacterium]|nr:type II secretion system F family protein [Candidatus Limimonas coprohippi]
MSIKQLDGPYLSSFCMELSLCLKAGISLTEGLFMLSQDETDKDLKEMLTGLYKKMDAGVSLEEALTEAGCFPKYLIDMIEIGSRTGRQEAVLSALSAYYTRQVQITRSIKNAVVYPFVLMCMLLLVIGVLITKVLPIFNDVFNELGAEMSPLAISIMNFGTGVTKYSAVILAVLVAIAIVIIFISAMPNLSLKFVNFWNKFTSNRKLAKKIASARFANGMAMTLASGLDTEESLDMVERITENPVMLGRIAKCRELMKSGELFVDAVAKSEIFSSMYCRMLSIGFKTGTADQVMDEIARRSEMEVDENIESVINKVEPTLVIIMSIIVGVILLSVMLPLMSIMTTIG